MTDNNRPDQQVVDNSGDDGRPGGHGTSGHSHHRWMMLVCIAPLLVIAAALILTGSVGFGSTVFVVGCVAMMTVMMFVMGRDRH